MTTLIGGSTYNSKVLNVLASGAAVSIAEYGAVEGGEVDCTEAVQECIDYAQANNLAVFVPSGDWLIIDETGLKINYDYTDLTIIGMGSTSNFVFDNFYLQDQAGEYNEGNFFLSNSGISAGIGATCTLKDFCVTGRWGDDDITDFDEGVGMIRINLFQTIKVDNLKLYGSRSGGLVGSNSKDIFITNSHFESFYRDAVRFETHNKAIITGNYFKNIQDDSVALPRVMDSNVVADSSCIISGNTFVDSQGILVSSTKLIKITNNILIRPMHRGIGVAIGELGGSFEEGGSVVLQCDITGNVISDGFDGTVFSDLSGGDGFKGIVFYGGDLTSTDTVGTGSPVVQPYPYMHLIDIFNDGLIDTGNFNIKISKNSVIRTLETDVLYSSYGFGDRLSRSGWVDPTITEDDIANYGIYIESPALTNADINDNTLTGITSIPAYIYCPNTGVTQTLRNVSFNGNTVFDHRGVGLLVNARGRIDIKGNTFDGDPYLASEYRNTDGSWTTNYINHAAIFLQSDTSTLNADISGNSFANVGIPFNQVGTSTTTACNVHGNTSICDPSAIGYDAGNKGIGYLYNGEFFREHLIVVDCDSTSSTFNDVMNICYDKSITMPSTGTYVAGMFVRNTSSTAVYGWKRRTTGSAHAIDTDWAAI